jgi:general secretion pathway protein D
MVSLNFSRADLVEIIHIIAQHLRLTYTIDPEVKGTVTINSAEPLRPEDLLPIFHQVLRMNDAVAVRTGNLYHIMPINKGKGVARPAGQSQEDSFTIQIVPVRFFSVAEIKKILTPFLRPGGEIIEYSRGNFLIIVDLPSSIQRLMEIVDLIDVQIFAGTRMEIYQPKVASAEELAQEMTKIMQSFAASAPQADSFASQFIPIPRINQLLVINHSEAAWVYTKRWLDRIDVIAEGPGRRIFIYPVENGKATELADVLSQALGLPSTGTRAPSPTLQSLHRTTPGGVPGQPGQRTPGTSSFGAPGTTGLPTQQQYPGAFATVPIPGQPAAPTAPTPGAIPTPTAPGVPRPATPGTPAGAKPEEQLRIVPDAATNSLIIYGTSQEFQNIRTILKDLDAIPRQVLLDALVLQIDLKDSENFGVDYEILRNPQNVTIFNKTFDSRGAVLTGALVDALTKLGSTGVGRAGLVGVIGTGNDARAFVNALMTDSRVKLLSSPSVLAADNRPARIQVGSEEPIATGTINAAVGQPTVSSSTTIQYRNTGRILTIIPQINSLGLVNLQIKAEISARGEDVKVGAESFPSFNTQDAETTAVVQDGETLVIGGLIGERKSKGRSGIPYLMDLPVVGRFFGTTNDETTRTELLMLITPRVIRNRDEARTVTEEFKQNLSTVRNELERMKRDQERERENLKRQTQPQKPVAPVPTPTAPSPTPAPSSAPVVPGISQGPGRNISVPSPSEVMVPPAAPIRGIPETEPVREARLEPTIAPSPSTVESGEAQTFVSSEPPLPASPPLPEPEPVRETVTPVETTVEPVEVAKITVAKEATAVATDPLEKLLHSIETNKPPEVEAIKVTPILPKPTKAWVVQVASFDRQKDAEDLAYKLMKKGYHSVVSAASVSDKIWFRVHVGPVASRGEASELQKKLAATEKMAQSFVLTQ